MKLLVLTFILFGFLFSCTQRKEKKTDTHFTVAGFIGGGTFTGGVLVWGLGPKGEEFSVALDDETEVKNVALPTGLWNFWAIGWLGATPLAGSVKCGTALKQLDGPQTNVAPHSLLRWL